MKEGLIGMTRTRVAALAAVLVATLVWTLPAVAHSGAAAATTTVAVTIGKPSEFRFTLSKKTVARGTVVFKVVNRGNFPHDFAIRGKKTPLLQKGKSATLKVVFTKVGSAAYECTVPGHAAAGMKGVLKVA